MTIQNTLFDPYPSGLTVEAQAALRSRRCDPQSSLEAAERISRSGVAEAQLQRCVELVRKRPGLTSKELAETCDDLDRYQMARRLPEAERCGLVRREQHPTGLRWWPSNT